LAAERRYPFQAEDAPCEKGVVPPPIEFMPGGLLSKTTAPLVVRRGRPGAWQTQVLRCIDQCRLAPPRADEAVVVSAPGAAWAGISRIGPRLRATLAGPIRGGVRHFRSLIK
jgi:hypothetical protein